ncbi:hypothetical protein [Methylosinus sp. Ce-a6]|uniref:hypothetical protein n=1 Tax=Methylosinus sp. Ce-a6 TaxID=2172005 RepID=UPI0013577C90|nr:hypothetical protein [Methylosinus sp. Ce-a6]
MGDEPENPTSAILRRLDAEIDGVALDIRDIEHRLTALEVAVANLAATEASHYANVALRADRTDDRLDRVEKRLSLAD